MYLFTRASYFFKALALCLLLLLGARKEGYGQTKMYAYSFSEGIRAWRQLIGEAGEVNNPPSGIAEVTSTGSIGQDFSANLTVTTKTIPILNIGANGEAWIQYKFDNSLTAGTKVYIPFDLPTSSGVNLDLLNLVGGLLGLIENNIVNASVYLSNGNEITGNLYKDIVKGADGKFYLLVTALDSNFNSVRFSLRYKTQLLGITLGSNLKAKTYDAFYLTNTNACQQPLISDLGRTTGIQIDLSQTVKNPQNAIDENTSNYSEISTGALAVAASASQNIYFPTLSEANSTLKVRLQISTSTLNASLLGAYHIRTYNGNTLVSDNSLVGGVINGLDLLGLLSEGGIVTVPIEVANLFDRVEIGLYSTVGLNLSASNLRIYGVSRTSASCPDSHPRPSPLISPVCVNSAIVSTANVDDAQNAVDGNFDSYATIRSDAGILVGLGSGTGHLEVAFGAPVPAGKTAYIRIDYDESVLKSLLAGSLGDVIAKTLDNLVLGNHYFDVVLTNAGSPVLSASGSNTFANAAGQIRIVQDKLGRYYIAIKSSEPYTDIRITDHTASILGLLTPDKYLNVYNICYENSEAICDPPFATYYDGDGIDIDLLNLGNVGVIDAQSAIDSNPNTASKISIGAVGIGASMYQYVNFHTLSATQDHFRIKLKMQVEGTVDAQILGSIVIKAFNGDQEIFSRQLTNNGLISELDLLYLLQNHQLINLSFAPGQPFDRIAVGIESLVDANVITNPLELYSVERFSADCVDPETVDRPGVTLEQPHVCEEQVEVELHYTTTVNNPTEYMITWGPTLNTLGFADVPYTTLLASPIQLTIPSIIYADYDDGISGVLRVKNTNSGLESEDIPFTIIVHPKPDPPHITAN